MDIKIEKDLFVRTHLENEKEVYVLFYMIAQTFRFREIMEQLMNNSPDSYVVAEYTLEEAVSEYAKYLGKATTSVFRLNSYCKTNFGVPFLNRKVDMTIPAQCYLLIDAVNDFIFRSSKLDVRKINWLSKIKDK